MYTVVAGKLENVILVPGDDFYFDQFEENIKYSEEFQCLEFAIQVLKTQCAGYHFARIEDGGGDDITDFLKL